MSRSVGTTLKSPASTTGSSALASKATGFPIAKLAAKLAVGYTLDEIPNDITKQTPASFEPTLDYVVVKVPRFAFEKFPTADPTLTTHMKSVGEAMSIGRNFTEAFNKALRSMENKAAPFRFTGEPGDKGALLAEIKRPHDDELASRTVADRIAMYKKHKHYDYGYIASFWLLSQVLLRLDLGVVYAIWCGVGIAVVATVGVLLFGESLSPLRIAGLLALVLTVGLVSASLAVWSTLRTPVLTALRRE